MGDKKSEEKHEGPHGPDCKCDGDGHYTVVGEALARVLAGLLPGLVEAWDQDLPGISFDIRFDHGKGEFEGIALRAKVLEDVDWPEVPDLDTLAKQVQEDSEGYFRWEERHPPSTDGNGVLH